MVNGGGPTILQKKRKFEFTMKGKAEGAGGHSR